MEPTVQPIQLSKSIAESGYVVPKGEEGLFHVELEQANDRFDAQTGIKKTKPYVQKFNPKDFTLQIEQNDRGTPTYATLGLRMNKVLHIPDAKYLEGVRVNIGKGKFIHISEMLERNQAFIDKQPK